MIELRTAPILKMVDLSKIEDKATRDAFEQLLRFMFDNQRNIYDDINDTNSAIPVVPPIPGKATQEQAEAASDDVAYMTPLQVKNEVQKSGSVLLPIGNIPYKDEDDMASNSDVHVPTQQSVKAFVIASVPTLPVKASGSDIDTGTDDSKFATSKAIRDSGIINTAVSGEISALTEKTTLADDDVFLIEDSAASNSKKKVKKSNISSVQFQAYSTGSLLEGTIASTERSASGGTYAKIKQLSPVYRSGTVTVRWEVKGPGTRTKVYKNGVAVGSEMFWDNSSSYATKTDNISVSIGDVLQIYAYSDGTHYVKNMKILVSNPTIPGEASGY